MHSRILIADDHPVMRSALKATLERELDGEICGEAGNGQEAVQKAAECHPDLIILDLGMPILNGLQAARKIHSTEPEVPILLYTVYRFPALEMEAQMCGIRKVVDKGGSVSQLLGAVEDALRDAQTQKNGSGANRKSNAKAAGKQ